VTGAVDIGHLTGWLFAERQIVCCSSAKWCVDKNHVIKQKDFTQKVATENFAPIFKVQINYSQ
jgi:hypothetical protein